MPACVLQSRLKVAPLGLVAMIAGINKGYFELEVRPDDRPLPGGPQDALVRALPLCPSDAGTLRFHHQQGSPGNAVGR